MQHRYNVVGTLFRKTDSESNMNEYRTIAEVVWADNATQALGYVRNHIYRKYPVHQGWFNHESFNSENVALIPSEVDSTRFDLE